MAEQEEPVLPLDESADLVGGAGKPGIGSERAYECPGQPRSDGLLDGLERDPLGRCGVGDQEKEPQVRVILVRKRLERFVEPVTRFMNDDDGHDRRCAVSLRFHDVPRLAARPRAFGSLGEAILAASIPPPTS
jgi:hypothetical protein